MLSTSVRMDLLSRASELYEDRKYRPLLQLLQSSEEEAFRSEPELGFYYSAALLRTGQYERAISMIQEIEIACAIQGNARVSNRVAALRAVSCIERGDLDLASEILTDLLYRMGASDHSYFSAMVVNNLGVVATIRCEWDEALANYSRASAFFQRTGDSRNYALCQHNVAMAYRQLGFLEAAEAQFVLALQYARESGIEEVVGLVETERALLLSRMGDPKLGLRTAHRVIARGKALQNPLMEAEARRVIGTIKSGLGEFEDAERFLGEAMSAAQAMGNRVLEAELLEELAVLSEKRRNITGSLTYARDAARLFHSMGASPRATAMWQRLEIRDEHL